MMSGQSGEQSIALRNQCTRIKHFPLGYLNVQNSLVDVFPPENPYRTLALNLQKYEQRLAGSTLLLERKVRSLLGDTTLQVNATSELHHTEEWSAQRIGKLHDQVSALLAGYRLLDLQCKRAGAPPISVPHVASYPNSIIPAMLAPEQVSKTWKKLYDWKDIVQDFSNLTLPTKTPERMNISVESPFRGSLYHLHGLLQSDWTQKFTSVVQNFRGAAFHLTWLKESASADSRDLPLIPENLHDLILPPLTTNDGADEVCLTRHQPDDRDKIRQFLSKRESSGALSLPLHLALLLSPLFLLMPKTLSKSKFPRASVYELSCALGNQKPEVLARVEDEIWTALWIISGDSSFPVMLGAFRQMMQSDAFREVARLPADDPALTFFRPITNVHTQSQVLTAEVAAEETAQPTFSMTPFQQALRPTLNNIMDVSMISAAMQYEDQATRSMEMDIHDGVEHPHAFIEANGGDSNKGEEGSAMKVAPLPERRRDESKVPEEGETDRGVERLYFGTSDAPDNGRTSDSMEMDVDEGLGANSTLETDALQIDNHNGESGSATQATPLNRLEAGEVKVPEEKGTEKDAQGNTQVLCVIARKAGEWGNGVVQAHQNDEATSPLTDLDDDEGDELSLEETDNGLSQANPDGAVQDVGMGELEAENDVELEEAEALPEPGKPSRKRRAQSYTESKGATKRRKNLSYAAVSDDEEQQEEEVLHAEEQTRWVQIEDFFMEAEPLTLDTTPTGKKKVAFSESVTAWGPQGQKVQVTPKAHSRAPLEALRRFIKRAEETYVFDKPLYAKHDGPGHRKESVFKILTKDEYLKMKDDEVQKILTRQHIVVTEIRSREQTFQESLLDIAPGAWVTTIHDQSYGPQDPERLRSGRIADLLEASTMHEEHQKILNALDFPDPLAGMEKAPFASESFALSSVFRQDGWMKMGVPIADMRFKLASLKHSFTEFHQDSDGLGTFIKPLLGSKWWFVARTKGELGDELFETTSWLESGFDLNNAEKDVCDVEAILLTPTCELIMQPKSWHAVYTPEHSVCAGGHFYATSTMQDSFIGLVHTFVCDRYITNISHFASRFILAQILNFYHGALVKGNISTIDKRARLHIPSLHTWESRTDLLITCALGVLMNVLSHQTYTAPGLDGKVPMNEAQIRQWDDYDINGLSEEDRKMFCLARAQSFELIDWLACRYKVQHSEEHMLSIQHVFKRLLRDVCYTICDYKWRADKKKIACSHDFTLERLKHQINAVLDLTSVRWPVEDGESAEDRNPTSWEFPSKDMDQEWIIPLFLAEATTVFSEKNTQEIYEPQSRSELFEYGETELDKIFASRLVVKRETTDD